MNRRVRWTKRAADQFSRTALYLEEQRKSSGAKFIDQVEAALAQARLFPRRFPNIPDVDGEVRRALIQPFGYWVIYQLEGELLVILSVWYGGRQPDGWKAPK